jgi:GH25 family lysozyme M1 (1,4-beta-N-acetylmuramidase)
VSNDPLLVDVYAGDLNGRPDWGKLAAAGWPWCGAIVKASEGLDYYSPWFGVQWRALREVAKERYGVDWFRGAYHYARLQQPAIAQVHRVLGQIEAAGGWGAGDLPVVLDVERANNPERAAVEDWVCTFAFEYKAKTGRAPILYGNVYLWENGVRSTMGCDALIVARYTPTLPADVYKRIGWSWSSDANVAKPTLLGWQYVGSGPKGEAQGDARVTHYPLVTPMGVADTTAVVVANGGQAALAWIRRNLLAKG